MRKKKEAEGATDNFAPGFGIKFLRSGIHSGNTVSMYGVNGQNSWNFFKNDFSNHIGDAEGIALKLLQRKFSEATEWTGMMGLRDMAKYDQDGNDNSSNLKFPYKLIWRPDPDLARKFTDFFTVSFMDQLESIPVNTVLYNLYVLENPTSKEISIGKLVLRKKFTRSNWGDKTLFFRHGYMDDDFAFHPEWMTSLDIKSEEFQKKFMETYGFAHP